MRYRLIDTAGSELAIVNDDRPEISEGDTVQAPDGSTGAVVEVYDDEAGREGDVVATLVIDEDSR